MQLVITRESLAGLPPVSLPEGYALRHFRPGDEPYWEAVLNHSFGESDPPRRFVTTMACDSACCPERVLFVARDDIPVATASAWYKPEWGADTGYVHYVGTDPAHKGKRLGYWVSLAVLHRFVFEGRTRAVLQTDDFRVPAIKIYLRLGFAPWLVEEEQRERWRKIVNDNQLHERCPDFDRIDSWPVHAFPKGA